MKDKETLEKMLKFILNDPAAFAIFSRAVDLGLTAEEFLDFLKTVEIPALTRKLQECGPVTNCFAPV